MFTTRLRIVELPHALPYGGIASIFAENGYWLATIHHCWPWSYIEKKSGGGNWCDQAGVDAADVAALASDYCEKNGKMLCLDQDEAAANYYAALTEG